LTDNSDVAPPVFALFAAVAVVAVSEMLDGVVPSAIRENNS